MNVLEMNKQKKKAMRHCKLIAMTHHTLKQNMLLSILMQKKNKKNVKYLE